MAGHIGIVACSAPGAALCYQTICTEAPAMTGASPHTHPEISLHGVSFHEHVRLLEAGDWETLGQLLLQSADKLAAIGADVAICPDNTIHQALSDDVLSRSPIPWLHIADAVVDEARRAGLKRLGILGTRYLTEGPVYPDKLGPAGIAWAIPEPPDRERVNQLIFDHLVQGQVPEVARSELRRIMAWLGETGKCDGVVLGCTELPLAVDPETAPLPVLDSTRLLARAAIRRTVGP